VHGAAADGRGDVVDEAGERRVGRVVGTVGAGLELVGVGILEEAGGPFNSSLENGVAGACVLRSPK